MLLIFQGVIDTFLFFVFLGACLGTFLVEEATRVGENHIIISLKERPKLVVKCL